MRMDKSFLPECEQIMGRLERGTAVTRYNIKRKPERKILALRREIRMLVWLHSDRFRFDNALDVTQIREVRLIKNLNDFLRCKVESVTSVRPNCCLVIRYGSEFNLKQLIFVTISEAECRLWVQGLDILHHETLSGGECFQIWMRKSFYEIQPSNIRTRDLTTLNMSDIKKIISKIQYKVSASFLKEQFAKYDIKKLGDIGFDDFTRIMCNILHSSQLLYNEIVRISLVFKQDVEMVSLSEFRTFLMSSQGVPEKEATSTIVADRMRMFLRNDTSRDIKKPFFTLRELVDWLFSKDNELLDPIELGVHQDMNKPLCDYWISSSHNTYLTGDQISSESSLECYARCLRMGCRSVELDCWDGPDGYPIIYHGHTLTSKIKFCDVITVIKDHAFVTSDYPVILSMEDHCSVSQQRKMAMILEDVFGSALLTTRLDNMETELPSPEQLKRRIILKHKKLCIGESETGFQTLETEIPSANYDISNSVKNGILYIEDDIDVNFWIPHFFVLFDKTLYYAEIDSPEETYPFGASDLEDLRKTKNDEDLTQTNDQSSDINANSYLNQTWFYPEAKNRKTAEDLLNKKALGLETKLQDGIFLVRPSGTFIGDFSLSFMRNGSIFHVPIKNRQNELGEPQFYLISHMTFASLDALIFHYMSHPLKSAYFDITLRLPTAAKKSSNIHTNESWFYENCSRTEAETALLRSCRYIDGAFLVRKTQRQKPQIEEIPTDSTFVISFVVKREVKHCVVTQEGGLNGQYHLGNTYFPNLVKLISHYENNPLYAKVRLKQVSSLLTSSFLHSSGNTVCSENYLDPCQLEYEKGVTAIALYDYTTMRADELSLLKGCVVTNIHKDVPDEWNGWWRGDYNGAKQLWFPANYVKEIRSKEALEELNSSMFPLGSLQKGSLDISQAKVTIFACDENRILRLNSSSEDFRLKWILEIDLKHPSTFKSPFYVATDSKEEATDWARVLTRTDSQNTLSRQNGPCFDQAQRSMKIARELSDLVVYCSAVVFDVQRFQKLRSINEESNSKNCITSKGLLLRPFYEMSSFPESKAEKLMLSDESSRLAFLDYHKHQISRVYPKSQRVDSSNYNPVSLWAVGVQMVALNFQTGDKNMQINQGRFLMNGNCGFVLRPSASLSRKSLNDSVISNVEPDSNLIIPDEINKILLNIRILGARHLSRRRSCRGILSPFVEIEIIGIATDSFKLKTSVVNENGFNPTWNSELFQFKICHPQFAMLRLSVHDLDMFGDAILIGQYTLPVNCIRVGFRSVSLKNSFSEELELSALLVHVSYGKLEI